MKVWIIYSIIALFILCAIDLGKKYMLDNKMVGSDKLVIYSTIMVGLIGCIHLCFYKSHSSQQKCKPITFLYILGISICIYLFSIIFTRSIDIAPDVSFPIIIVSISTIIIYLISSIGFSNSPPFNLNMFVGILCIILGLAIFSYFL